MRLHTLKEQTDALKEAGFPALKGPFITGSTRHGVYHKSPSAGLFNYSVGELLSFLPKRIDGYHALIDFATNSITYNPNHWVDSQDKKRFFLSASQEEFIDTLVVVLLALREKGVLTDQHLAQFE